MHLIRLYIGSLMNCRQELPFLFTELHFWVSNSEKTLVSGLVQVQSVKSSSESLFYIEYGME
jgi:hypothetical protein